MLNRTAREAAIGRLRQAADLHALAYKSATDAAIELHAVRARWGDRVARHMLQVAEQVRTQCSSEPEGLGGAMAVLAEARQTLADRTAGTVDSAEVGRSAPPIGREAAGIWIAACGGSGGDRVPGPVSQRSAALLARSFLGSADLHESAPVSSPLMAVGIGWPLGARRSAKRNAAVAAQAQQLASEVEGELDVLRRLKTELGNLAELTRKYGSVAIHDLDHLQALLAGAATASASGGGASGWWMGSESLAHGVGRSLRLFAGVLVRTIE